MSDRNADIIIAGMSHGIDLRAAVIFDGFIIAEDFHCRLWRWQKNCWRPLSAGYQQPSYRDRLARKYTLQNVRPQQQRSNEKRDRGKRRSLSGDMAKHGADSGSRSPQLAGKRFQSR